MEDRLLALFGVGAPFHENLLFGFRIPSRHIHEGGEGGRGGGEYLGLLGPGLKLCSTKLCQLSHVSLPASGVCCHEIVGKELGLSRLPGDFLEPIFKPFDIGGGFAHKREGGAVDVFGGDFKLA